MLNKAFTKDYNYFSVVDIIDIEFYMYTIQ